VFVSEGALADPRLRRVIESLDESASRAQPTGDRPPASRLDPALIASAALVYLVSFLSSTVAFGPALPPSILGHLLRLSLLWLIYDGRSWARVVETVLDVAMLVASFVYFEEMMSVGRPVLWFFGVAYYTAIPLLLWLPPVSAWMRHRRRQRCPVDRTEKRTDAGSER
jgi:hypothetical protein